MYEVTVFDHAWFDDTLPPQVVQTETFPFGEWDKIGYWLLVRGFISSEYHVVVNFKELLAPATV